MPGDMLLFHDPPAYLSKGASSLGKCIMLVDAFKVLLLDQDKSLSFDIHVDI
jgi:hypothetical protein